VGVLPRVCFRCNGLAVKERTQSRSIQAGLPTSTPLDPVFSLGLTDGQPLHILRRIRSAIGTQRAAVDHPKIRLEVSLREKVLAPWKQMWPTGFDSRTVLLPLFSTAVLAPNPIELSPEYDRLVLQWAQGHNLAYEWVVAHARRTVLIWLITSPAFKAFAGGFEVSRPSFQPPLKLPEESERIYLARQVRQLRDESRGYMRDVQRSRKHIPQDRGSQATHYRWAVERVCLGWKWADIAKRTPGKYPTKPSGRPFCRFLKKLAFRKLNLIPLPSACTPRRLAQPS
jgi:hypothetical protein